MPEKDGQMQFFTEPSSAPDVKPALFDAEAVAAASKAAAELRDNPRQAYDDRQVLSRDRTGEQAEAEVVDQTAITEKERVAALVAAMHENLRHTG